MKFLAIETEKENTKSEDFNKHLKEEALKVWELHQADVVREIYFNDEHNAVLILECKNKEEAIEVLNSLPLVRNGLIEFFLMNLYPYTGFERLFNK